MVLTFIFDIRKDVVGQKFNKFCKEKNRSSDHFVTEQQKTVRKNWGFS